MLACKCALSFAVQVQKVAEILAEVPRGVYCNVDAEVRGLWFVDWDLQDKLAATVQLA
jgi:hypothetical protein